MFFLPTHCDACLHSALVGEDTIKDGASPCLRCGEPARTLPGQAYSAKDKPLFAELEDLLHEAQLGPVNALQLARELTDRFSSPGRGLKRIARLVPALSHLQLIVADHRAEMRRAEGMLATMLEAIGARHRQSGFISTGAEPRPVKTGEGLL